MDVRNGNIGGLLGSLRKGEDYKKSPPFGPLEELPTLSKEEIEALQYNAFGEDIRKIKKNNYAFDNLSFSIEDRLIPRIVDLPKIELFDDLHIYGISGCNNKIGRSAFYLILAKSSLLNFRYSTQDKRPYFNNTTSRASAIMTIDENVFVKDQYQASTEKLGSEKSIVSQLEGQDSEDSKTFRVGFKPIGGATAQALGWGVKLQQALELSSLSRIPIDKKVVCIKGGTLLPTSVSPLDIKAVLTKILTSWKDQVLMACSTNIQDSVILVESLLANRSLRTLWFPGQEITTKSLKSLHADYMILDKILNPGQRTPLIEGTLRKNIKIIEDASELKPITCYYRSRQRPHTYIRLEFLSGTYKRSPQLVNEAIEVAVWQFELGKQSPLVEVAAKNLSSLETETFIVEKQVSSALEKQGLDLLELN